MPTQHLSLYPVLSGLPEPENDNLQLTAYPNQFSESVQISFSAAAGNCQLEILNTIGKRVYSLNTANNTTIFTWNSTTNSGKSLPNGLYIVQLPNGQQQQTTKLILNR